MPRLKLNPVKGAKALLILTDGFDSGSTHTLNQALDELHKAGATAYAIQYPSDSGAKFAPELYSSQQRPGEADLVRRTMSTIRSSRIQADLRRRYVLRFRPEQR